MKKAVWSTCIATLVACGGSEPPAQAPEQAAPPPEVRPKLQMHSELGSVDPDAVTRVFHELGDRFTKCQQQGLDRVEVLAGRVKFFVRISDEGAAKWAYLEDSELGDRETEKCLIAAALDARWPKPDGGEAEARYSMDLPLQTTRPPNDWGSDKVSASLEKSAGALQACKSGGSSFHATMYVGPGGRVLAAGVATGAKDQDEKADCLAGVLGKLRGLPSPGSWPAKVSFAL
jgi:hypothetical protein